MLKTLIKTIAVQNCNFPEKNAVLASPRQRRTKVPQEEKNKRQKRREQHTDQEQQRREKQTKEDRQRREHHTNKERQRRKPHANEGPQRQDAKKKKKKKEKAKKEEKDKKRRVPSSIWWVWEGSVRQREDQCGKEGKEARQDRVREREGQRGKNRKRSTTTRPRKTRRRNESGPAPRTPRRQSQTKRRRKRSTKTTRKTRSSACTRRGRQAQDRPEERAGSPREREALQVAYTAWNDSDLALFLSDIVEHAGNMAGRDGAQFELAKVHGLALESLRCCSPTWASKFQSSVRVAGLTQWKPKHCCWRCRSWRKRRRSYWWTLLCAVVWRKGGPRKEKPWQKGGRLDDAWKCCKAWLALRLQIHLALLSNQAHLHLHPKNLPVMTLLPAQTQIDFACCHEKNENDVQMQGVPCNHAQHHKRPSFLAKGITICGCAGLRLAFVHEKM